MNTNLSTLDRYVRLVGGIMLVGSALSMRKSIMKQTVMAVGAMKVAEGAIGWCPVMHVMGVKDTKTAVQLSGSQDSSQTQNKDRKQTTDMKQKTNSTDVQKGNESNEHQRGESNEHQPVAASSLQKEGAQMDTPRMERQENSSDRGALSPIEAHRVLEGSDALNTTYQ